MLKLYITYSYACFVYVCQCVVFLNKRNSELYIYIKQQKKKF